MSSSQRQGRELVQIASGNVHHSSDSEKDSDPPMFDICENSIGARKIFKLTGFTPSTIEIKIIDF